MSDADAPELPCREKRGTNTGYRRHMTENTRRKAEGLSRLPVCRECKDARSAWQRGYHKRRIMNKGEVLMIPAVGTQRRLRALAVMGWSWLEIGKRLGGLSDTAVFKMAHRESSVRVETAQKITALFDELCLLRGPGSSSVRTRALAKGWAGPLEWDEDTIDDPDAQPCGESARLTAERQAIRRNLKATGGARGTVQPKARRPHRRTRPLPSPGESENQ